ncbi:MAG TPA: hypothetical protein VGO30_20690, partial [Mycobacterium sp.]|nr:hypothetical protein [Mycobacterium sp.]
AIITAATLASLKTFTLDLSDALTVAKVSVNGRRPASFHRSRGKLSVTLASALPASRIGAGATVGPASLVMRGDEVPASTRWQGNPIAPWNPFRKKRGGRAAKVPKKSGETAA